MRKASVWVLGAIGVLGVAVFAAPVKAGGSAQELTAPPEWPVREYPYWTYRFVLRTSNDAPLCRRFTALLNRTEFPLETPRCGLPLPSDEEITIPTRRPMTPDEIRSLGDELNDFLLSGKPGDWAVRAEAFRKEGRPPPSNLQGLLDKQAIHVGLKPGHSGYSRRDIPFSFLEPSIDIDNDGSHDVVAIGTLLRGASCGASVVSGGRTELRVSAQRPFVLDASGQPDWAKTISLVFRPVRYNPKESSVLDFLGSRIGVLRYRDRSYLTTMWVNGDLQRRGADDPRTARLVALLLPSAQGLKLQCEVEWLEKTGQFHPSESLIKAREEMRRWPRS